MRNGVYMRNVTFLNLWSLRSMPEETLWTLLKLNKECLILNIITNKRGYYTFNPISPLMK